MNKKRISIGLVTGILLIAAIVFLYGYNSKKSTYSCYRIPLADGKLSWGMDTAEVIDAVGEPSSITQVEYGNILTYDIALPCDFGNCVQAVFYIGIDDKTYANEKISSGLKGIDITVDNGSKDAILEKVSDFYGELSPDGGETVMEMQFAAVNPDYFYQYHFCESWRLDTLPEDAFNRLLQVQTPDRMDAPIDKKTRLMYVDFWGTNGYPCTIRLDAAILTSYLNIEN